MSLYTRYRRDERKLEAKRRKLRIELNWAKLPETAAKLRTLLAKISPWFHPFAHKAASKTRQRRRFELRQMAYRAVVEEAAKEAKEQRWLRLQARDDGLPVPVCELPMTRPQRRQLARAHAVGAFRRGLLAA